MNFEEAFNALELLNEEALCEKLWVSIKPNGSENYYNFFTVEDKNKQLADITDLLGSRKGTYKQTIDKVVLNELIAELKQANIITKADSYLDPKNYTIVDPDIAKNSGKVKILTLADRALRRTAHTKFSEILNNSENNDLSIALKDALGNNKYLIHHINGNEAETTLDNIVLIPYEPANKDDLKIANGIHGVLHGATKMFSKSAPVDKTVLIFYFENGELRAGKCNMKITL